MSFMRYGTPVSTTVVKETLCDICHKNPASRMVGQSHFCEECQKGNTDAKSDGRDTTPDTPDPKGAKE